MRQPRVTLFWSLIISRSSSGQTFIHKWRAWQEKRLCPEGRAQTLSLKLSIMGWEELGLQRQMHLGSVELRQVLSLCALGFPICKVGDNYNCKVRVIVIWYGIIALDTKNYRRDHCYRSPHLMSLIDSQKLQL